MVTMVMMMMMMVMAVIAVVDSINLGETSECLNVHSSDIAHKQLKTSPIMPAKSFNIERGVRTRFPRNRSILNAVFDQIVRAVYLGREPK